MIITKHYNLTNVKVYKDYTKKNEIYIFIIIILPLLLLFPLIYHYILIHQSFWKLIVTKMKPLIIIVSCSLLTALAKSGKSLRKA